MQWTDLFAALALYLVLEGIMPFAHPSFMKRVMLAFAQSSDRQLRVGGLMSMLAGLVLLYVVRA